MTGLSRNAARFALLAAFACTGLAPTCGYAQGANVRQSIAALLDTHRGSPRDTAILRIAGRTSSADVRDAVDVLDAYLVRHPDDRYAELYYGYGLLYRAREYLDNKNYMKAAELAKQGFFYIDEAAERMPDDWRLRYLRARMDAFSPARNGRCVVALKDTAFLTGNAAVPVSLHGLIETMKARAQQTCNAAQESRTAARHPDGGAPPMTPSEVGDVLKAAVGDRP